MDQEEELRAAEVRRVQAEALKFESESRKLESDTLRQQRTAWLDTVKALAMLTGAMFGGLAVMDRIGWLAWLS